MDFLKNINNCDHKLSLDPSGIDICGNSHVTIDVHSNKCIIDTENIYIESDICANSNITLNKLICINTKNNIYEYGIAGGAVPRFSIIIWWKTSIPEGWAICDGTVHLSAGVEVTTPDMSDKYIRGKGSNNDIGETEGSHTVQLTTNNIPTHTHSINLSTASDAASHTHSLDTYSLTTDGGGAGHEHNFLTFNRFATANNDAWGTNAIDRMQSLQGRYSWKNDSTYASKYGNHTHTLAASNDTFRNAPNTDGVANQWAHTHSFSGTSSTHGSTNPTLLNIKPNSYTVIFIMKL